MKEVKEYKSSVQELDYKTTSTRGIARDQEHFSQRQNYQEAIQAKLDQLSTGSYEDLMRGAMDVVLATHGEPRKTIWAQYDL